MNRRIPLLLIICFIIPVGISANSGGTADNGRNRISRVLIPAFAIGVITNADVLEGVLPRERWRINIKPSLMVSISFAGGLSAGITLPFSIVAGFPFYSKHSFTGGMASPNMEIAYIGSTNAISYRLGMNLAPFTNTGNLEEPHAGTTASIGFIRDPVALRFEVNAELGPAAIPGTGIWVLHGVGGSTAVLIVINQVVSIELGVVIQQPIGVIADAPPPAAVGRTGLFARVAPFSASLFISRDLWHPTYPASLSAGVTFLWET